MFGHLQKSKTYRKHRAWQIGTSTSPWMAVVLNRSDVLPNGKTPMFFVKQKSKTF